MSDRHGWRFTWLTTWDEIWDSAFLAQWQECIDSATNAHVFFEPTMVRMWVTYCQAREHVEPRFAFAEHASGCKVLFPLVSARLGWQDSWCRVLQPVGARRFDYHDPVCCGNNDQQVFSSFWTAFIEEATRSLSREIEQIIIPRVQEPSAKSCQGFHAVDKAPFIDLRGMEGIDTVLSNGPKSVRQDTRRQLRRLEGLGDLQLKIYDKTELRSAEDALAGLIRAYSDQWGAREEDADFYRQVLSACLPAGLVHISALMSCGVPISWHMGFLYKKRFYYYKIAYDKQFKGYSPGKVHLMKLIEESFQQHVNIFDFLRGEEEYKYDWTKSSTSLHRMQIDMPTLRAQLARRGRRLMLLGRTGVRKLVGHA